MYHFFLVEYFTDINFDFPTYFLNCYSTLQLDPNQPNHTYYQGAMLDGKPDGFGLMVQNQAEYTFGSFKEGKQKGLAIQLKFMNMDQK